MNKNECVRMKLLSLLKSSSFSGIRSTLTFPDLFFLSAVYKHLQQLNAAFRDVGAWSEDSLCTMVVEELVILWRNNPANADENIIAAQFLQLFHDTREQCLMSCRQGGEANNMNIVIHCILSRTFCPLS